MAPNDPKQAAADEAAAASAAGRGGFFSSIASTLSNFGSAMTKSVNGYDLDSFVLAIRIMGICWISLFFSLFVFEIHVFGSFQDHNFEFSYLVFWITALELDMVHLLI